MHIHDCRFCWLMVCKYFLSSWLGCWLAVIVDWQWTARHVTSCVAWDWLTHALVSRLIDSCDELRLIDARTCLSIDWQLWWWVNRAVDDIEQRTVRLCTWVLVLVLVGLPLCLLVTSASGTTDCHVDTTVHPVLARHNVLYHQQHRH